MLALRTAVAAITLTGVASQAPGTLKTEKHPTLTTATCTKASGCTNSAHPVVVDSNWRWIHKTGQASNCYTGNKWDTSVCSDVDTCTKSCELEGADEEYEGTYGIKASGSTIDLSFVTQGPAGANVGSRTYLMKDDETYELFKLKNRELSFDVDVSTLPCGLNGALYFVQMDADGGKSKFATNTAGAKYGTGYCDAQCPHDLKYINGESNVLDWTPSANDPNSGTGKYGTCCAELDIWEANSISTAFTAHSCDVKSQTRCESATECGDTPDHRFDGVCDKNGCDFQPYRLQNTTFFGPGSQFKIDSTKKMTVTTQFVTADGTDTGPLKEIRRVYQQGGAVIRNPTITFPKGGAFDSLSTEFCQAEVGEFQDHTNFLDKGGMGAMDAAMEKGLVLVMSIWDDHYANMLWLDSTYPTDGKQKGSHRGTCDTTSGAPKDIEKASASAHVAWSNIRFGEIGSTTPTGPPSPPSPTPPSPSPPSPKPGCPGGSLDACVAACPSDPVAVYAACTKECGRRCLVASPQTPHERWGMCTGADDKACPTGWECVKRPKGTLFQCSPVKALTAAFAQTHPTPEMLASFLAKGTTMFPAAGLA